MGSCGGGEGLPVVVVVHDSHHLIGKEYVVNTGTGKVSVTVYEDPEKPGLITYPDLGVNYVLCFQGLFSCPEAASLFFDNFCVYHIHPPGHQVGAPAISRKEPVLTVGALADQILEAWLSNVHGTNRRCLYPNAICDEVQGPSPWFDTYFPFVQIYVMARMEACGSAEVPQLGVVQACRRLLGEKHVCNIWRYLHAIDRRHDLTRGLKSLTRPTLIFIGDHSPFISDVHHMSRKLGKKQCTLVEVQDCGSMVTEEQQLAMQVPLENFLMRYRDVPSVLIQ